MDLKNDQSVTATLEQVGNLTKETLESLAQYWRSLYDFDDNLKAIYFTNFVDHLENFYNDMITSQKKKQEHYLDCLKELKEEQKKLEEELDLQISIDEEMLERNPLKVQIDTWTEALKVYRDMKVERLEKLSNLVTQEEELCRILGETRLKISPTRVACKIELDLVEEHIKELEREKACRLAVYSEVKNQLKEALGCLELNADTTLEKLFAEQDDLVLTPDRITELKELKQSLMKKVEAAKNEAEILISELKHIWCRIDEVKELQDQFLDNHKNHFGKNTLNKLQHEITRCKAILRDNLEFIIRKIRIEIKDFAIKLTFTDEQIQDFSAFNSDEFTEECLEIHEKELQRLKIMFTDASEILELAEKRKQLWERMIEIEESANDKNRLFNNRGGQLLKEEKERKWIDNNLPKIEKQLSSLLREYEGEKGRAFLWHGENLLMKIATDWQHINAERENRKAKLKVQAAKSTITPAPLSKKRKTPQSDKVRRINSKKVKTNLSSNVLNSTVILSKGNGAGGVVCRTPVGLQVCNKLLACSSAGSYSDFQERLETTPRPALMEVDTVAHSSPVGDVKTPKKTPGRVRASARTPRSPHPNYFVPYTRSDRFKF